jgi:hypothetical protein
LGWCACGLYDVDGGKCGGVVLATQESIVKLRSLAVFGAGYILGTRAGRERYGQIITAAQSASKRLEGYGAKLDSYSRKIDSYSGRLDGFRAKLRDYSSE